MSRLIKVSIIYYSATGTVHSLATGARDEAAAMDDVEVRLRKVEELAPAAAIKSNEAWAAHVDATSDIREASLEDLGWADVVMLGSPTRYGLPTSQLKQFIDITGPMWEAGQLVNKVATSFTASATLHGGQESTILAMNNAFYHWGCIIVPPGYVTQSQFESGNPYGTSHVSGTPNQPLPGPTQQRAIRFQTRRAVDVARALQIGGISSTS